jgi:hypothetical protein
MKIKSNNGKPLKAVLMKELLKSSMNMVWKKNCIIQSPHINLRDNKMLFLRVLISLTVALEI